MVYLFQCLDIDIIIFDLTCSFSLRVLFVDFALYSLHTYFVWHFVYFLSHKTVTHKFNNDQGDSQYLGLMYETLHN